MSSCVPFVPSSFFLYIFSALTIFFLVDRPPVWHLPLFCVPLFFLFPFLVLRFSLFPACFLCLLLHQHLLHRAHFNASFLLVFGSLSSLPHIPLPTVSLSLFLLSLFAKIYHTDPRGIVPPRVVNATIGKGAVAVADMADFIAKTDYTVPGDVITKLGQLNIGANASVSDSASKSVLV